MALKSTPAMGWKFLGPFKAFLPLAGSPCHQAGAERMRFGLCKDLTYMWEGHCQPVSEQE